MKQSPTRSHHPIETTCGQLLVRAACLVVVVIGRCRLLCHTLVVRRQRWRSCIVYGCRQPKCISKYFYYHDDDRAAVSSSRQTRSAGVRCVCVVWLCVVRRQQPERPSLFLFIYLFKCCKMFNATSCLRCRGTGCTRCGAARGSEGRHAAVQP